MIRSSFLQPLLLESVDRFHTSTFQLGGLVYWVFCQSVRTGTHRSYTASSPSSRSGVLVCLPVCGNRATPVSHHHHLYVHIMLQCTGFSASLWEQEKTILSVCPDSDIHFVADWEFNKNRSTTCHSVGTSLGSFCHHLPHFTWQLLSKIYKKSGVLLERFKVGTLAAGTGKIFQTSTVPGKMADKQKCV